MTQNGPGTLLAQDSSSDPATRMLFGSPASQIALRVARVHDQLITATERLSEEQISWRPNQDTPPIQFHLWHIARYADRVQVTLAEALQLPTQRPRPPREVWEEDDLATRWGLNRQTLGPSQTGWGMDDHLAAEIRLPPKAVQLDYARRAFAAADALATAVVDLGLFETEFNDYRGIPATAGSNLLGQLTHACRHLGMIEALTGAQGLRGTAST